VDLHTPLCDQVGMIIAGQEDPEVRPWLGARIALLIEERVPLIVIFWGDPSP